MTSRLCTVCTRTRTALLDELERPAGLPRQRVRLLRLLLSCPLPPLLLLALALLLGLLPIFLPLILVPDKRLRPLPAPLPPAAV